jgi:3-hydroxyisobutyrate dehydrogenase-like beta-hydroxyacid dehydrogenase
MDRAAVVAVIGTGDMGAAIGGALRRAGLRVVSDLSRRSAHSRSLAQAAGIEDLGSLSRVVREAGLLLSIVPPAVALEFAADVAAAMSATGGRPTFVDCNAVAPETMRAIAGQFTSLGATVVDVGIVGRGPPAELPTRLYFSGPERAGLELLNIPALRLIDMGEQIGTASALKMAYAALNKGTDALHLAVLLMAEGLGVRAPLMEEFAVSQASALRRMHERVPFLAATADRYSGEMLQIAATCDAAGVTPLMHEGAAWLYERLATTSLAAETRATLPRERTLDEALAVFVQALQPRE